MDGFSAQILNAIPNLVFAKDRAGRYTMVNRSHAEAYGSTPAAMVGRTQEETGAPPEKVAEWRRTDLQAMDTLQDVFIPEERFVDAAGRVRWVQTHKRPIIDPDGASRQVLVVSTDITASRDAHLTASRLAAIVSSSTEAIMSADVEGKVTSWNPAAERLFGYSEAEMQGRPVSILYPEGANESEWLLDVIRKGTPVAEKAAIRRRKDGSIAEVSLTLFPLRDLDGEIIGISAVARDISELKRANERLRLSEAQLADAQRVSRVGSWWQDLVTGEVGWTEETTRQLGYSAGEVAPSFEGFIGRVHPEDRERVIQSIGGGVADGSPISFQARYQIPGRDGGTFHSRGKVVRDAMGNPIRLVGTVQDVSAQKQVEATLERAVAAAGAANVAKSEFLANMSHEIRTPMNGVLGMLELVLDTELEPSQRQFVELAHSSAESLLTIINEILDFSKIEAGMLELNEAPFDVGEVVADTVSTLALRAHHKGLELTLAIDEAVPQVAVGDAGRLRQIIVNLVGNAIKFTERGEVDVRVEVMSRSADHALLHVAVQDTGIGIPLEKQAAVFEAFVQGDASTTRDYGGTGLGLSISRQLINAMGGEFWLESEPGVGSTFHFSLRLGIGAITPRQPAVLTGVRGTPVLAVDDNATNRQILERMLRSWGMEPTCVDSGQAALAAVASAADAGHPYPLMLLDAQMPGMSGFDFVEQLRRERPDDGATIMMLSSADARGDRARCRALGISLFVTKPVRQSDLLNIITEVLGEPAADGAERATTDTSALPDGRALSVLVAEDNTVNQKLAERLLVKRGHRVTIVSNGRLAVEAVAAEGFDVVLMDAQMPVLGGLEATRLIRDAEHQTGRHVPIVAMTARAMAGDRERCLEAGMDEYIAKPIRIEELARVLGQIGASAKAAQPGPATASHPPDEPAVDVDELLALVGGDRELVGELFALFAADAPMRMAELRDALSRSAATALAESAHALKGAAGSLHASEVERTAGMAERCAQAGDIAGARHAVDAAASALERALERMTQWSAGGGAESR